MFTLSAMISLLFALVIVGLIVWLLLFVLDYVGVPEPFHKVGKVLIILFAVVWLIYKLLPFIK